jgi:hypothetical protein
MWKKPPTSLITDDQSNTKYGGVKTEHGKAIVRNNARRHGILAELKTKHEGNAYDDYETQISPLEATRLFSTVDVEQFLNTLKLTSEDYDEVEHDVKDAIAKIIILNLFVAKEEVDSISLKPPFDEFILHPLVLNGGPGGI